MDDRGGGRRTDGITPLGDRQAAQPSGMVPGKEMETKFTIR